MSENDDDKKDKSLKGKSPTLIRRIFGEKFGWPITLIIGIILFIIAFDGHEAYLGQQSYLVGLLGLFLVFTSGVIALDYGVGTLFGARKREIETGKQEPRSIQHGCAVAMLILLLGGLLVGGGAYLQEETTMENLSIAMIAVGFLAVLYSFQHAGQAVFEGTGRFLWKFSFGRVLVYIFFGLIALVLTLGLYQAIIEQYQSYISHTE